MRRWACSFNSMSFAPCAFDTTVQFALGPFWCCSSPSPASSIRCLNGSLPVAAATVDSLKWDSMIHATTHPFLLFGGKLGERVTHQCSSPNASTSVSCIGPVFSLFCCEVGVRGCDLLLLVDVGGVSCLESCDVARQDPFGFAFISRVCFFLPKSGSQVCISLHLLSFLYRLWSSCVFVIKVGSHVVIIVRIY